MAVIAGVPLVAALLLFLILRRPRAEADPAAVAALVSQQLQPILLDVHTRLASLEVLGPLKETTDQRLPHIEKTTEALGVALSEIHKARTLEEKAVRETLAKLQESTKTTPEVAVQVQVLKSELKRLTVVESGVQELMNLFLSAQGRGQMGEEAVRRVFESLPPDLWDEQYNLAGQRVDYALHMPNGRVLPIDSKTSGLQRVREYYELGERIAAAADDEERKRLLRDQGKLQTEVRAVVVRKAAEVASYIQPDHGTLGLAIQAVPDALYAALDGRTRKAASDQSVHVVPYGLLAPVLHILRGQNQYDKLDFDAVVAAMQGIRLKTMEIHDALENKFDKAQKFIASGMRDVEKALDAIERNAESLEAAPAREAPTPQGVVVRVPRPRQAELP